MTGSSSGVEVACVHTVPNPAYHPLPIMHTRDTFNTGNMPQHYITHITAKETHFSKMAPHVLGIWRFSTDCEVIVTQRWTLAVHQDCQTCYCITRQCGLKGGVMARECLFWFDFFSKAILIDFSASSATFSKYDLKVTSVIIMWIVHSGNHVQAFVHVYLPISPSQINPCQRMMPLYIHLNSVEPALQLHTSHAGEVKR